MLPSVETDLEGLKDYLAFQFCLAGKTLFKGIRELPPGHFLRLKRGVPSSPAATGRSSTRSTGTTTRRTSPSRMAGAARRVGRPAHALRRPGLRLPLGRRRLERGRLARSARAGRARRLHGQVLRGPPLRRVRVRADRRRAARARPARDRHRRRRLHRADREGRLPHGLSGGRPRLVPPVHGLPGRGRAGQGDPRRPGRRRDLRRLHPLPGRLLRAVHQGGDRRDRCDSGNFVVTYESIIPNLVALRNYKPMLQRLLEGGPVRRARRPLLPPDQPRPRRRERGRHRPRSGTTRRSRPSRRSSTGRTSGTRPTSTR